MGFKTVYKIDKLLKDEKGNVFLTEKELERLNKSPEEYKLLYFLRKNYYKTFHDFPGLGAMETVLAGSFVKGPFISRPKIKEKLPEDYSEEIIRRFIPADKVPESFKKVELMKYGVRTDSKFASSIAFGDELDREKIKEVGEYSLKKLKEISQNLKEVEEFGRPTYKALVNDCVVEFDYSKDGFYYPSVNLRIFGIAREPPKIVEKLGLYNLEYAFKSYSTRDLGLEKCSQEGLAHNFSIKDFDVGKISELENIIL